MRFGYTHAVWRRLRNDIFSEIQRRPFVSRSDNGHGEMFVVECVLPGRCDPAARAQVVTVWIVPYGTRRPRLVTAYPV